MSASDAAAAAPPARSAPATVLRVISGIAAACGLPAAPLIYRPRAGARAVAA